MLGMIEGRRGRGPQRMSWLDGITDFVDMKVGKLREMVRKREAWHAAVLGLRRVRQNLVQPMDRSTPGFPVLHHLPELGQTHVH